jgi:hypothetical protein
MDSLYDSSSVGWFDICATGAADLLLAIQAVLYCLPLEVLFFVNSLANIS